MRAGQLRHRFELQAPAATVAGGDVTPAYDSRGFAWGELEGLTGTNRGGITAEAEYRIRVRFRADLDPRWRVVSGSRVFGIISAVDPDGRRRELVLLAREILS
jgi:head-tail adaptor